MRERGALGGCSRLHQLFEPPVPFVDAVDRVELARVVVAFRFVVQKGAADERQPQEKPALRNSHRPPGQASLFSSKRLFDRGNADTAGRATSHPQLRSRRATPRDPQGLKVLMQWCVSQLAPLPKNSTARTVPHHLRHRRAQGCRKAWNILLVEPLA